MAIDITPSPVDYSYFPYDGFKIYSLTTLIDAYEKLPYCQSIDDYEALTPSEVKKVISDFKA